MLVALEVVLEHVQVVDATINEERARATYADVC
jgi:hypothetical protein